MQNSDSLDIKNKNLANAISNKWDNLDENTKSILKKIWNVITYKWQLQILLNTPFLIYWLLDKKINMVHQFNLEIVSKLNLPDWLLSMIGFTN
tara:strand:- start:2198 stop:2476 length:279 start_codon:yes stop_codon:yes gene_type:complete